MDTGEVPLPASGRHGGQQLVGDGALPLVLVVGQLEREPGMHHGLVPAADRDHALADVDVRPPSRLQRGRRPGDDHGQVVERRVRPQRERLEQPTGADQRRVDKRELDRRPGHALLQEFEAGDCAVVVAATPSTRSAHV